MAKYKPGLLCSIVILLSIVLLPRPATAGATLSANRSSVAFGNVIVGSAGEQSVSLTNHGATSVTITKVVATGTNFSVSGITLPLTVPAGHAIAFIVHFAPKTVGNFTGTITVASNASDPSITIVSTGLGMAQISVDSPTTYFIGVAIGSKGQHPITLTNNGKTTVTISKVAVSGAGFSQAGLAAPATLAAGKKITFTEYFAPAVAAEIKGAITVYSNASDPVLTISSIGVSVQQLSVGSAIAFGEVAIGSKGQHTITVTNHGNAGVRISKYTVNGTSFSETGLAAPVTIAAQSSVTFTAYFAPRVPGVASGAITITSNASNPSVTIALTGSGAALGGYLTAVPASAIFQKVTMGNTDSQSIKLSNATGKAVLVSHAAVSGKGFQLAGLAGPLTIPAGGSTTFNVMFTPAIAGTTVGTLSVISNAANSTLTVPISGSAVAATVLLGTSLTSMNFQKVSVGADGLLGVTLTNKGTSKLAIASVRVVGAGFSESGVASGLVLEPAQSTTVNVMFKPAAAGTATGSVVVASNATNSPTTISVLGTGVPDTAHVVDLVWSASTSSEIVGYHVYRASVSGGPYVKLTPSVIPAVKYVDSSVQAGETYYYVVTSINSAGIESARSTQVSARIPSP